MANIVNESGLYSLILGSRKPEVKTFKRWVTHEVSPSIRRAGQYRVGCSRGPIEDWVDSMSEYFSSELESLFSLGDPSDTSLSCFIRLYSHTDLANELLLTPPQIDRIANILGIKKDL